MPSLPPLTVIRVLDVSLAVCRLDHAHAVSRWMTSGPIWSVTRTPDELSVICPAAQVPEDVRHEGPFAAFMLEGPLAFALTGIVARLSMPLAEARIPIFVTSTFDTDYMLVPEDRASAAMRAWREAGVTVR